ncbi:TonB-dependent receptor [Dyella silvatica]|uniref:TonB-dependent receptor n=1 Tax=Dyella silvatica TaxID=2992128 RepID=UPI002252992E|nr:TonB-dependent receptor [Dyella silvatica]
MENTNGPLANDQTHQLRILGTYQPTPEWRLSTVTRIASGTPISCIGQRPLGDPFSYGAAYFWCGGQPAPRGSYGRNPWTYTFNVSAAWQPAFFNHKVTFSADVFNLLGKQRVTQVFETCENASGVQSINCFRPRSFQDPRYVRLGARYDFSL